MASTQRRRRRRNRNRGETILTSTTVAGLRPDYSLAKVGFYGECGGWDFQRDVPVSDGTSLYWFDGARVKATTLSTGVTRWSSVAVDPIYGDISVSEIAVSGGNVVVGFVYCDSVSEPDGYVAAYSASTGKKVWRTPTLNPQPSSLAIVGSRVLASGANAFGEATQALSLSTGTRQWINRECAASYGVFSVAGVLPVDNCEHSSGTYSAYSAGLSLTTGARVWTKGADYRFWRGDSSAVTSPNIYISDLTNHVVAMRPNGTRVWRSTETGQVFAAGPKSIFTDCGGTHDSICALDRTTGARRWKATVGSNASGVALAADVVYPYLRNANTGATLRTDHGPYLSGRTGVAAGRLWTIGGRTAKVYALP